MDELNIDHEKIILIFDKGNISDELFEELEGSNIKFICTLRPSTQKQLHHLHGDDFEIFELPNKKKVGAKEFANKINNRVYRIIASYEPYRNKWYGTNLMTKLEIDIAKIDEWFAERYVDLISRISQISFGFTNPKLEDNLGLNKQIIELSFNQEAYISFLELTMLSQLPDLSKVNKFSLNYGLIIETESGEKLGYPAIPNNVENDQESWISEFDIVNAIKIVSKFSVDLRIDHIEVTQAVQTPNNALSLIKNKDTVVRVFIDGPRDRSIEYEVKLAGSLFVIPIVSLGVITQYEMSTPRIDRLAEAFEFVLPNSWVSQSGLNLRAEVSPIDLFESNPRS